MPNSTLPTHLATALTQGLAFLTSQHNSDGSFPAESSPSPTDFSETRSQATTFAPATIALSLSQLRSSLPPTTTLPYLNGLLKRTTSWLQTQRSPAGTWNYWSTASKHSTEHHLPDDLDDTALALAALWTTHPQTATGGELALLMHLLTILETHEGGPYQTWCVAPTAAPTWHDVDLAVNSNLARLLRVFDLSLESIDQLATDAITTSQLTTRYYPDESFLWYSLSAWYQGEAKDTLKQHIISSLPLLANRPILYSAWSLTALTHLQAPPDILRSLSQTILTAQQRGAWPAAAVCLDMHQHGSRRYLGSSSLTTAFCLEALALCHQFLNQSQRDGTTPEAEDVSQFRSLVLRQLNERLTKLPSPLTTQIDSLLNRLQTLEQSHQVATSPYLLRQALGKHAHTLPPHVLVTLAQANCFGWLAYSLLDDAQDIPSTESKNSQATKKATAPLPVLPSHALPLASTCLRYTLSLFSHALSYKSGFLTHLHRTFDTMDATQRWELTTARATLQKNRLLLPTSLPNYESLDHLAHKSQASTLASTAVLYSLDYTHQDTAVQEWLTYQHHWLIARQLHDDAHDWEADLIQGHLTPVVTWLLQAHLTSLSKSPTFISLTPKRLQLLRTLFWKEVLPLVCQHTHHHLELARGALTRHPLLTHPKFFLAQLAKLKRLTTQTQTEHTTALEFLDTLSQ